MRRTSQGFTMIELMIVVALTAILLMVVVPSFRDLFAGKRVEGIANELSTDLQFARSEAVSRRTPVRITFVNDRCYVVHRATLAVSSCVGPGADVLKTVTIDADSTASLAAFPSFVAFEPVRGVATGIGDVVIGSSVGSARLRVSLSTIGRVSMCVPSGYATTGYKSC